jgi:hypothetical protein
VSVEGKVLKRGKAHSEKGEHEKGEHEKGEHEAE